MTVPPLTPGQLHQRSQRECINRAFCDGQPGTLGISGQQGKIVPFIAALHIYPKIVPCPPETGEPGTARWVLPNKDAVLILLALIKRIGLDTRLQQLRVDAPALQIGQHHGGEPAGLWQFKGLRRFRLGLFLGRRGAVAAQGLHRAYKVHSPDLDEIVQRRPAPDAPAVPAPFPMGDFQAVMGPGTVFVRAAAFQLMGFVGLQIG